MTISILISDDHTLVAEGLRSLISTQPDFSVVGIAANGREAVKLTLQKRPEVVVMDNIMPELNGIEAARIILEKLADVRVVMLSMHSTTEYVHRALRAGVMGYVLKESVGRELVNAIRTVHSGRRYLSKPLADEILDRVTSIELDDPLARLSSREREVLQLVTEGKSVAEIADKLSLSRKTVETYRVRMMEKLDIHDLVGLVRFAIQRRLISLD